MSEAAPRVTAWIERELLEIARPAVARRARGLEASDREDLLQEVLIKYLRTWTEGDPDNVASWFETVTANALIDFYRAQGRRHEQNLPDNGDDPVSAVISELKLAKATSLWPVRENLIRSILGLVSEDDRTLLERRYLDGCSAADLAAEQLGLEVANVDQRTTRAKRRLREQLRSSRPDLIEELRNPHPRLY